MHVVPEGCPLSGKELEALQLLAQGLTYKEMAQHIGRNPSTVRSHLNHIYNKLGVHDRARAVLVAAHKGWIEDTPAEDATTHLLFRIEQLIGELCQHIRRRNRLTQAQKELLSAFDAVLYAREDDEYVMARQLMDSCVNSVAQEAHLVLGNRRQRDLVELLTEYILRQRHTNLKHSSAPVRVSRTGSPAARAA